MQIIKQSTARTLLIGPFLDDTDGKSAETGLTIAQVDVRLSKNGGNMAQKNESTSCTHDELGYYTCPVDTTDTATLGILKLMVHESGALPVWQEFLVVTANVWDSLCSTDTIQADITQIGGVAQSATDLKDLVDTSYDPSNHKIQSDLIYIHGSALTGTAGQLAAAFTKLFDVATPLLVASEVMRGTDSAALAATALTDATWTDAKAAFLNHSISTIDGNVDTLLTRVTAAVALASVCTDARIGELDAANLPTDIANVKAETALIVADTNELQGDWVNGGRLDLILDACAIEATVIALNNISISDVNNQVIDVLKTDTTSEMVQGAPPASPTIEEMIAYLYFKMRNKQETTATEDAIYDDTGVVKLFKSSISDDNITFTKGEYTSGA